MFKVLSCIACIIAKLQAANKYYEKQSKKSYTSATKLLMSVMSTSSPEAGTSAEAGRASFTCCRKLSIAAEQSLLS